MGSTIKLAATSDPNRGRNVQFISGIQGVAAGSNGTINMGNDRRYLRLKFQCAAVNYTGGTGQAFSKITGSGVGGTGTLTINAYGVPTSCAVVTGGSGYVTNDTITIADATGAGLVMTVTASAGAITALAITTSGTPTAVSPVTFFSSFRLSVGGRIIRDISPDSIIRREIARGICPRLGELPINFAESQRNFLNQPGSLDFNDSTGWDMRGKGSFDILFGVTSGLVLPTLIGVQEFDLLQNIATVNGKQVLFDNPIWSTEQSVNVPIGKFDVTTLKFTGALQRLWVLGSTPGQISQMEVYQDNNKRLEATLEQMLELYTEFGLNFGQPNYLNSNYSTSNAIKAAYNPFIFFDAAYLPDIDGRLTDRLYFNSLMVRVYSSVAQTVKFVIESAPNSF